LGARSGIEARRVGVKRYPPTVYLEYFDFKYSKLRRKR
jgi:hypothetical protein